MRESAESQGRVIALLGKRATYPEGVDSVVHVQTHISHVFLAGPYVYKLKKAVTFPFLDFSTVAAREHFCREEIRLNRRLAPAVYLGVLPVTEHAGRLRLGGDGTPADWVVRMRRLPDERGFASLLERGAVGDALVRRIAAHVAAFHAVAPVATGGGPEALLETWRENLDGVRAMAGTLLSAADFDLLEDFGPTYVVRHDAALRARVDLGHVREGHGDLRVDHVYVLDDPLPALADAPAVPAGVQVVDCVEFSTAFRSIDVAADLSFLVMELESLGREDLARVLVAAYVEAAGDPLVPALLPYHAAYRAVVRGKVEGLAASDPAIEAAARTRAAARARRQFVVAGRFAWRSGDPVVIACAGLSGTGKSAVASLVADASGFATVSSDVLRRAIAPAGEARYTSAARAAVYAAMRREVERMLAARESVIVDATFVARAERDRLARTARGFGRRLVFVECEADEATVRRRLEARDVASVSDARVGTYLDQCRERDPYAPDEPTLHIDTSRPLPEVREDLLRSLWRWRQGRPAAAT